MKMKKISSTLILFAFLVVWTPIYGGWLDLFSFLKEKEPVPFHCPHKCGQFGSEKLQDIEWKFTLLLYQADKIHTFLSKYSQPYDPLVFKGEPSYPTPQDFHSEWHEDIDDECKCYICDDECHHRWIRLGIDDLDKMRPLNRCEEDECRCTDDECWCEEECTENHCWQSRCYVWGIKPMTTEEKIHIGHIFTKKEYNYVNFYYDDYLECYVYTWDCIPEATFMPMPKIEYRFDRFVDFKEACFSLNQELIWLREDVHGLNRFIEKQEIRSVSDKQYKEFLTGLGDLQASYSKIFSSCAENHQAPSALYQTALAYFQTGDHARGLQCMKNVFERVDLSALEPHLASNIALSQGVIQNEIALYDQALLSLKQAIDHNPHNKEAYFDRALTLFEQGKFKESVESYLHSEHSIDPLGEASETLLDFSLGLIKGITTGATYSLAEFLPSICSSLYGLSHGLWAFVCSPNEVSKTMISAAQTLAHFLNSHTTLETLQALIPELQELATLSPDEHQKRGEITGTIIGKYGMEYLTCFGTIKGLKLYRELKQANGAQTLHTLNSLEKGEKLQALSHTWWEKTAPMVKEIKKSGERVGEKLHKAFRTQNLSELQVK